VSFMKETLKELNDQANAKFCCDCAFDKPGDADKQQQQTHRWAFNQSTVSIAIRKTHLDTLLPRCCVALQWPGVQRARLPRRRLLLLPL
jgi:hypothetical protein